MSEQEKKNPPGSKPAVKRTIQDSVFTALFSIPENAAQLAISLGLEKELHGNQPENITIQRIVSRGLRNDLAFRLGDKALVLVESQSYSAQNLPFRMPGYCADVAIEYLARKKKEEHNDSYNPYSSVKIPLPPFKLFALQPHLKAESGNFDLSLYDKENSDLKITVHIIVDVPSDSLVRQYFTFCRKYKEICQRSKKFSKAAFKELYDFCLEHDVLKDFFKARKGEIYQMLYEEFEMSELMRAASGRRSEGNKKRKNCCAAPSFVHEYGSL